jgi:hypothetical protein
VVSKKKNGSVSEPEAVTAVVAADTAESVDESSDAFVLGNIALQ